MRPGFTLRGMYMRIGVAMALYNGRKYLKEQIDSLLGQTVVPDIIVCCDDGSTDGTMDWLEGYVAQTGSKSRFVLVRNNKTLGYVQNFYKALDLCDADVMFLCDQDDVWGADKIELMCRTLIENPQISLLSCAHGLIGDDGSPISSMRYGQVKTSGALLPVSEKEVITYFLWPGMTMALKSSLWKAVREDAKNISAPHDRVLALFAASRGQMYFLDTVLCSHRLHDNNSGGEEGDMRTILNRAFKLKELSTSFDWLEAQIAQGDRFSAAAQKSLCEYRNYVGLRLQAVQKKSIFPLLRALRCSGYVHWKGLAADIITIIKG